MTASFGAQFASAFTGKPAKPRPERKPGERTARVDPSTRLTRWAWRWRLHLALLAVPGLVGGAGLVDAASDPQLRTLGAWWARTAAHNVADERVPAPAYPKPADPWTEPKAAAVAFAVGLLAVGALTLVRTGRWGRLCRREARWRTERLLEHRWEEAMLALGLTVKRFGRTRTPRLERVRSTKWGGFEGRVWFPKGFEMGKLAGGDQKTDQLLRRELELPGRGSCEQLVWSLPDENEATYRVVEIVHRNTPRPDQLQVDDRPADNDNTLRIGVTARGFIGWDLNEQPFLRCSGAPLALDTPIATPTGWTTMGEVKPGDWVFDETGQPTLVVGKSPVFTGRDCFEVVFDDGEVVVADAEHRWSTWDMDARNQAHRERSTLIRWEQRRARGAQQRRPGPMPKVRGPEVRTTADIRDSLRAASQGANHSIPVTGALDLPDADLPIDPYVLGVWLGDGYSSSGYFVGIDPEIADEVRVAGYDVTEGHHHSNATRWHVAGLYTQLRVAGLLNRKHIPDAYLRASAKQRLALLQGLMDTDGTVSKRQGGVELCLSDRVLVEQARELAVSLGHKVGQIRTRSTVLGGPAYRMKWMALDPVFRLPRKLEHQKLTGWRPWTNQHRYIVDVRPTGSVPVQCITVAADSHLFLAGRAMIPTHNSGKGKGHWARWIISQAVQKGWLVVIIDGAGAPEHRAWAGLPNVRYAKLRVNAPDEALAQFAGQVAEVQNLAATRQALCDALDLDDWKSMDGELRKEHPRVLVVFDEFTALMGKAPEDDHTKQLRQHLGWMINRMLRLYRKYGVNAVVIDQITYAGTWIGPDGLAQATQFVWCGMPNRVQQNMLSSGAKFPTVPNRPGYGLVGVAGELEATPIVWARFDRAEVQRIVAEQLNAWGLAA